MKRFDKVNVEISNVCNLKCSFCPDVTRARGRMEPEFFEQVVRQIAPLTEQVAMHLLGDPLVHPDLGQLVEICARHQLRIFLVTNGTLLRERQAELLLHPAFRQVCFSLHSFHDNYPDRDPTEYLERIFTYAEAALESRPDLYVNFRLWNLEDARGVGLKNRDLLERIEKRFGVAISRDADVRVRKGHRLRGRLYVHFDTEFTWPSLDLPVLGEQGRCRGLSSHFGILVDGTVVPCCLDHKGTIELGNLRDQTVVDILDSPRARAILGGFRKGSLVEPLCQRCPYIKRFSARQTQRRERTPGSARVRARGSEARPRSDT